MHDTRDLPSGLTFTMLPRGTGTSAHALRAEVALSVCITVEESPVGQSSPSRIRPRAVQLPWDALMLAHHALPAVILHHGQSSTGARPPAGHGTSTRSIKVDAQRGSATTLKSSVKS